MEEKNRPLSLGTAYALAFLGWAALAIASIGYFGAMAELLEIGNTQTPEIWESLGAVAAGGAAYYLVVKLLD